MERKWLEELGLNAEVVDKIIAKHASSTQNLNSKIQTLETTVADYDEKVITINDLEKQLKKANSAAAEKDVWEKKYKAEAEAHNQTISDFEAKESLAEKRNAVKKLLLDNGVKEDILDDFMLSAINYDGVTVKDGVVEKSDDFVTAQKERYGKYFGSVETTGVNVSNPPANVGGEINPWAKDTFNLTEQGRILKSEPEKAKAFAIAAGVTI